MPQQPRENHSANSVRQQNSESERGERRADQHQRVHCLHILNTLPDKAGDPSPTGFRCAFAACILASLQMPFQQKSNTLTRFSVDE
jgi:hypothetical protein